MKVLLLAAAMAGPSLASASWTLFGTGYPWNYLDGPVIIESAHSIVYQNPTYSSQPITIHLDYVLSKVCSGDDPASGPSWTAPFDVLVDSSSGETPSWNFTLPARKHCYGYDALDSTEGNQKWVNGVEFASRHYLWQTIYEIEREHVWDYTGD